MRHLQLFCLLLICSFANLSAEETNTSNDTVPNGKTPIGEYSISPFELNDSIKQPFLRVPYKPFVFYQNHSAPTTPSALSPYFAFIPGQANIYGWENGQIIASSSASVYPGLMKVDTGSIGISQNYGNIAFYIGGTANKYGCFHGLHTQYGINGNFSYRYDNNLSVTLFGTYYFGRAPVMPPSMMGFYNVSRFGGYVDYGFSEHFGVDIGAQGVQQIGSTRYELEPIVTPYLKMGHGKSKVKIGLPVGQILYHILKK